MGNKIDKICFCINANNANTSQDEQVIITFINNNIFFLQKITMNNNNNNKIIKTITQNNSNIDETEYQAANTSFQSRNQKNQTFHKQFFTFKNEKRSHRTSYSTSDSIYIGNYVNKKRNGQGKLILADQSYYEGNFKDGEFDGFGFYRTKNYTYKGQFINGKKNGKGKMENFSTKSVYEGEFKNDMKEGYGIEKYNDGSIYKGYYKEDVKHGNGELSLKKEKNISIYKGEFKNGKIWGKGKYKWDNKKEYEGDWENNEISGFGILTENNIKHIGYFSHDKKEGYGASFYIEKKFAIFGKWINGIIEGISIIFSLIDENNNDNINEKKIVIMKEGDIINSNLTEEEINEIKINNNEYINSIKLFHEKILPEYYKAINI